MRQLMWFNHSLQARLMMLAMVSVILALSILAIGILLKERSTTQADLQQELNSIGALIAANAQAPLLFEDKGAALDLLDALGELDDDIDGCILTASGDLFAVYPADIDWESRLKSIQQNTELPNRHSRATNVVLNGQTLGVVHLSAGMDRFYVYMRDVSNSILILVAMALTASWYIGRKTTLAVLRPLEKLEKGARDIIGHGDYAVRVVRCSDDELGTLTDSFNIMLEQIETRDHELTNSHEKLEQRVIERTQDLEIENKIRKQAEDEMRVAKVEAEEASRVKSEFLANMSHELRTPLHGILSYSQFGIREIDSDDSSALRDHFESIKESGEVLLSLLDDLLDLAKLEAGRMTFDFQMCRVHDLLEAGVGEFDSLISERKIEVHLESHIGDLEMELDPTRFMQVMRNLLSNAVKFSPEEGEVQVTSCFEDEHLLVEIADNGIGVPKNEFEAIYDKFIQSSKTKTGAGGTGLGLAITREITEAHGGRTWVRANPKGGAIFSVELPMNTVTNAKKEQDVVLAP